MERTRFDRLEDRVKIERFLVDAGKSRVEPARNIVQMVYAMMRLLEWPDENWSIQTTLRGVQRPFYWNEQETVNIGVILNLTVDGFAVVVGFHADINGPLYTFTLDKRPLDTLNPSDALSVAKMADKFADTVVEIVKAKLEEARPFDV